MGRTHFFPCLVNIFLNTISLWLLQLLGPPQTVLLERHQQKRLKSGQSINAATNPLIEAFQIQHLIAHSQAISEI